MDVSFCLMHFNRDSTVMIIINTLREMHLCTVTSLLSSTDNCRRPNHPRRAFQMLCFVFSPSPSPTPCCLRKLHPQPSVPLLSNLINVPVQKEREGCGSLLEEWRFGSLWRVTHLFFQSSRSSFLRNVQFVHTLNLMSAPNVPRDNSGVWTVSNDATTRNLMMRSIKFADSCSQRILRLITAQIVSLLIIRVYISDNR